MSSWTCDTCPVPALPAILMCEAAQRQLKGFYYTQAEGRRMGVPIEFPPS